MAFLNILIVCLNAVLVGFVSSAPLQSHVTTSASPVDETNVLIGQLTGDVTLERSRRQTGQTLDYSETKAMAIMAQELMEHSYLQYCETKHEMLDIMMNFGPGDSAEDICNSFGKIITDNNPMPTPTTLDNSADITLEDLQNLIRENQQLNFTLTDVVAKSMETVVLAGACMEFPGSHDPCKMMCDHQRKSVGELLCRLKGLVLPRVGRFLEIAQNQIPLEVTDKPFMELVIEPKTFRSNLSHLDFANIGYMYYAHTQLMITKDVFEKLTSQ